MDSERAAPAAARAHAHRESRSVAIVGAVLCGVVALSSSNSGHVRDVGRTFTEADADRVRRYLDANPEAGIGEIVQRLDISPQFTDQVAEVAEAARPQGSNFVNGSTAEIRDSDEIETYDEHVADRAAEVVAEFVEEYPYLAGLPVSEKPGQKLRAELVEREYVEEWVEFEEEWVDDFPVDRLDRAEPVTWAEAMFLFLTIRQPYDDGLSGRFEAREGGVQFYRKFDDCWTPDYAEREAAKNAGAERQLVGGVYPDEEESERAGESVEGVWESAATVMLSRTASSTPNGDRLAPVDFLIEIASSFNNGTDGVYHTVRNICEKTLGLEPDQWGYFRGDDVHGMGNDGDEVAGENACYPHSHDAIYIDIGAVELPDGVGTEAEIEAYLEDLFYPAIQKHLELCEPARPEAHKRGEACEAYMDLEKPAAYASEYLRLSEDEEMMEMSVEFVAFAAIEWATGRQRIARSQVFTDAAAADFCKQKGNHAERLTYRRGHGDPEVVCAGCNSPIGIEAETVSAYRLENDPPADSAGDGQRKIGVRVGEAPEKAEIRSQVEDYVDRHGAPDSAVQVLGDLSLDPAHLELVEDVLSGKDPPGPRPIYGDGKDPPSEYQLASILRPDGREEPVGAPGGGAEFAELVLPEQRLLRETRLRFHGDRATPKIVLERGTDRFATYNPDSAAGWLVRNGMRKPWHAELVLSFESSRELPAAFREPVAEPPGDL